MDQATRDYIDSLRQTRSLTEPAILAAIAALELAPGSRGLDVGCGIGADAIALARAVAPGGAVTGMDTSEAFLELAGEAAGQSGVEASIDFQQGSLHDPPFEPGSFDWLWCKDTFWPGPSSPMVGGRDVAAALGRLTRLVRPGGRVALVYWTTQALLPGHPELEARLHAAWTGTAPYTIGVGPGQHWLNAAGYMRSAGLRDVRMQPFAAAIQAPLDDAQQQALIFTIEMFFSGLQARVSAEDWAQYRSLVDPESELYLPGRDDTCCVITYCLFSGRVRGENSPGST